MSREKSSIGFGVGLIAGMVGGLAAGVLLTPKSGEESREKLKTAVSELVQKYSPAVLDAKKQAFESIDLLRYKLESQYKKFNNMLKSKKMQKAKELESSEYKVD